MMALRTALFAVALAALTAPLAAAQAPAISQPAPPAIAPPAPINAAPAPRAPPLVMVAQGSGDGGLGALRFQPVLKILPLDPPKGPQALEAGSIIVSQAVTPAHGVRLTSAPRRDAYGTVGELLWQARDSSGDYWCRLQKRGWISLYYCYQDRDGDGVFDALFENSVYQPPVTLQTRKLGKDEDIKKPVSYVAAEAPALPEQVMLRYKGVLAGLINDHDMVGPAVVQVELLVGESPLASVLMATYDVELDRQGKGRLKLATGQELAFEKVEVGGRAQITVVSGMTPTDEGFLTPPAATRGRAPSR
jgi:hypothetical protein